MRKLKIAYISCGTFIHVEPYMRFFSSRGHDVFWITYTKPVDTFGVKHYGVSEAKPDRGRLGKWKYLAALPGIRKVLREIKPDLLHGHYATSAGVLCLLSGFKPYILSVRGSDLIASMDSMMWRAILRRAFRRAVMVNTVSEQLATLTEKLGVEKEKILNLPQGIDVKLFDYEPFAPLHRPLRLVCMRALKQVYDPVTIINACEILESKAFPFVFTFAATGPLQPYLEKMVLDKGLNQRVTFLGGYVKENLPYILHNHDICLSASLWDGTSNSLLEAMACGLFPVVSRIESNQAWIDESKTGLMFECGNPEELAENIINVISNSSLRKQAIECNRAIIEKKADREKNMLRLEEQYYNILGEK